MLRATQFRLVVFLTGSLSLAVSGCANSLLNSEMLKPSNFKTSLGDGHGTEQRVITQFTDALEEDKEAAFRRIVSTRFEQKALRSKEAYKDLEILSLPKVKLEVTESKEVGDDRLEAVARQGKDGTKYQFIIIRDPEKRRWVVDDVMLRQQKKGTRATKSSVEVMDLLLTTREFLDTWKQANRNEVLQALSTVLREPMETLPEPWFQQLIGRISAEYETDMARRPVAQMNESDAVVKMPSKNGFLLMKVVRQDEHWLVADIEVIHRKTNDHPGSVLRQARAMNAVTSFLAAYQKNDLEGLKKITESKFYDSSLRIGDLSMISMPSPDIAPDDFEIQSFAGQLTVMIPENKNIVRMDLTTPEAANTKDDRKRAGTTLVEREFIIANVTVYDRETQEQQNLSSAFTAPARAMLFLSALQSHDLPMLRQTSSRELMEVSWQRIDPSLVCRLPLTGVPSGEMTLQNSRVQGEVTELELLSSTGQLCSVIMRNENGELKVVDVQYPDASAQVASLKTHLMLTVPVIELAEAWQSGSLESVKRSSSLDFNRLVWSNLAALPTDFDRLPDMLRMPVRKTEAGEQRAVVVLGDDGQKNVSVALVRENSSWVVDEISMPQSDGTAFELRKALRQEIAKQFLIDPTGGIQQANFEHDAASSKSGIVQAGGTTTGKRPGNLTVQSYGRSTGAQTPGATGIDMTILDETPPTTVKPADEENGVLKFGPAAVKAGLNAREDQYAPPRIRPRPVAEAVEEDGVFYFRGENAAMGVKDMPAEGSDSPAMPAKARSISVVDPGLNPVDIPLE